MTDLRLYDNTRLSAFKRCPRAYFFRHVLHWEVKGRKIALVFGSSWHAAMDAIWGNMHRDGLSKMDLFDIASEAFINEWVENGMPPPEELSYEDIQSLGARTPQQASEMIAGYIDRILPRKDEFKIIDIERPFAVPLDPNDDTLFYVGKIDKIVEHRSSKVMAIEHKTTSAYKKGGPFRGQFVDSFSPNSQVDGYLYALHMIFPGNVGGVWVDASLVHKSEEGYMFIPIERQMQHLDTWLWEVKYWIGQIEMHKQWLMGVSPDDAYMKAFPKNTNSCWDFNTQCAYLIPCKSWANPVGKAMPPGYDENRWDPLDHIKGLNPTPTRNDNVNKA